MRVIILELTECQRDLISSALGTAANHFKSEELRGEARRLRTIIDQATERVVSERDARIHL